MHKPNFLVIGAQKCGTTSLYQALQQHPQVYMSPVKEPRYFAFKDKPPDFTGPGSDMFKAGMATDCETYSGLFRQGDGFPSRGEASPVYLSSYQPEITAKNIHDLIPEAKLIAILRQPADRAWSAFLHHRKLSIETENDFSKALEQESWRMHQHWYPGWRYYQNGLYAQNLKPYLKLFDPGQIKVFLFEERQRPAEILKEMFQFLGVDPMYKLQAIPYANKSYAYRSRFLQRILRSNSPSGSNQFIQTIDKWNRYKPAIPVKIRRKLTRSYIPGILELEQLIGVDLSCWKIAE